jgi:anti-anti-sigma regulatory factor
VGRTILLSLCALLAVLGLAYLQYVALPKYIAKRNARGEPKLMEDIPYSEDDYVKDLTSAKIYNHSIAARCFDLVRDHKQFRKLIRAFSREIEGSRLKQRYFEEIRNYIDGHASAPILEPEGSHDPGKETSQTPLDRDSAVACEDIEYKEIQGCELIIKFKGPVLEGVRIELERRIVYESNSPILTFDLLGVNYFDTSAVVWMVVAGQLLKVRNRQIRIRTYNERLLQLLQIMDVNSVLSINVKDAELERTKGWRMDVP